MVEFLEEALARADALLARASYEEVQEALTACASLPGAEAVMPGIAQRRLAATWLYNRSDEEVERELMALLEVEPTLLHRASSTVAACTDRPNLATVYIPPLIAEIEAAAPRDDALQKALESARGLLPF
jgi:hypothetical protein